MSLDFLNATVQVWTHVSTLFLLNLVGVEKHVGQAKEDVLV